VGRVHAQRWQRITTRTFPRWPLIGRLYVHSQGTGDGAHEYVDPVRCERAVVDDVCRAIVDAYLGGPGAIRGGSDDKSDEDQEPRVPHPCGHRWTVVDRKIKVLLDDCLSDCAIATAHIHENRASRAPSVLAPKTGIVHYALDDDAVLRLPACRWTGEIWCLRRLAGRHALEPTS
jgi:hypothetical protein